MSRLRRGAFGVAALFAVALQALVVQTHVHAFGAGHSPAFAQAANAAAAHTPGAAGDTRQSCVVCQALANAGRMLAPDEAQIVRTEKAVFQLAAPAIRFVVASPSHSWRSRAPPIVL